MTIEILIYVAWGLAIVGGQILMAKWNDPTPFFLGVLAPIILMCLLLLLPFIITKIVTASEGQKVLP